ncbi:MAG: GAF domain-containing protein [Rhodocyclales bacterium]|nr:GAF domain-containing protein [Rhodocyclales bacterium]
MAEQLDIDFLLERDRHAEALLALSRRIEGAQSERDAFEAAFDILRAHTGYRHYWIFVFDADARHAHHYMGSVGPESDPATATLTIPGDPMLEEIATSRDLVVVEDARTDPRTNKEIVARIGNRTIVNVPILFNARNLGAVGTGTFGDEGVRLPRPAERDFLKAVASQLAISLDRIHNRSEWQRAEQELRMWKVALDNVEDCAFMMENERVLQANKGACNKLGYTKEELAGMSVFDFDPLMTPEHFQELLKAHRPDEPLTFESAHRTKAGRVFPVEIEVSPFTFDNRHLAMALVRDITDRKKNEDALRRLNRTLLTLSSGNEALVRAGSEAELLDRMCRILVEVGGHRIVWIEISSAPGDKQLSPAAVASVDDSIPLDPLRAPRGNALATALASGESELIEDIYFDDLRAECRADLLKAGCRSGLVLPLVASHGLIGTLSIFAESMAAFDQAELDLLKELADDLAYGIQAQRTHRAQQQAVARLQQTMEATIVALANTLELRDPYTAGHQRRVAQLAKAIALRIGIDAERAEAIYLAGMIHDIGKIYVPSEVLTRPGKLTPLEYSLVQTHVEAGYGILQPIEFPWPLADIVHQHHERLDGSGYPRGIRGDEIMLDARILAVADVVEAMSAHRPYRPGLGIDAAIAEIESGKERLYDATVVDGCIALFRVDDFQFA